MKKLAFLASIGAALGSVGLGHLYFQRLEAEVSGGPKVAVLVAAENVPVGSSLTEQRLALRDIPQAYVEERHVRASDVKKVLGARVAAGLKANEAILWTDMAKFNEHARVLSGLVQHGMRAVAVDGRTADFDGLLRPGDRVDVLFTTGAKEQARGSTTTLLQNLLVLSVGGNIARADDESHQGYGRGHTVTVSATVQQAQVLTQAQAQGRLTLTLRNTDDITLVEDVPETTASDIVTPKAPENPQPVKSGAERKVVEHVR